MRWMDRMNERAHLMGRMLDTIGAMENIPQDKSAEAELRAAAVRCMSCSNSKECTGWLDAHKDGSDAPMESCPNADLFKNWIKP